MTDFSTDSSSGIPEGWKAYDLGDLAKKIEGGGTPSREISEYWNGGIPWATVKDLKKVELTTTQEFISEHGLSNSSSKLIPANTVIIACRMAVGKAVFFNKDVAINQDLKAFHPNGNVDWRFLLHWYLFKSEYIESLGTGSTVKGVRLDDLKILPVDLPPLPEQQKIASILSSVDDVIEKTTAQIDKLKDLKTGMMQELLTKGIGHTEFKDSPVGRIPVGWEASTIAKSCKVKNTLRKPISKEERESMKGIYPYYGPTKAVDHINEYRVEGDHTLIGEDGDHFIKFSTWSMTQFVSGKFNVNNHAHIIEGTETCRTKWIYYYFMHRDITANLTRQGATRYKLNKATLGELGFSIPELIEQDKIIRILDAFLDDLDTRQRKLDKLTSIKKALMQDLLTGKVRVSVN